MAQTINQIEADIDRTRASLTSNLRELEHKVEAATDWREHFRARPWVMLGAAAACGFVLGAVLSPDADQEGEEAGFERRRIARTPAVRQLSPLLDDIADALVGVATSRVKRVTDDIVPGFGAQLARNEQRASSR
jgi:hypothetical protein